MSAPRLFSFWGRMNTTQVGHRGRRFVNRFESIFATTELNQSIQSHGPYKKTLYSTPKRNAVRFLERIKVTAEVSLMLQNVELPHKIVILHHTTSPSKSTSSSSFDATPPPPPPSRALSCESANFQSHCGKKRKKKMDVFRR